MTVTHNTLIIDVLRNCTNVVALAALFQEVGMHCIGCHLSTEESVAQACLAHDVNVEDFLVRVNKIMEFKLTKDTIVADILRNAPELEPVFYSYGMHCLGCDVALDETLEEACAVHGVDVDELLAKAEEVTSDFALV